MRRTSALACVALVSLCALWAAGPALSLSPYVPKAVDFELSVGGKGVRAHAAGGRWTSPVLKAPKRFDLLGLKWRSAGHVEAKVRVRKAGGRWSRWTPAPDMHDGPDGVTLRGSEPVWTGPSDELQLRMRHRPRGLKVHFVNASGTATAAQRARTAVRRALNTAVVSAFSAATARAAGEQPAIVSREEWGGDQCPPRDQPQAGDVQTAFVHHTVNANDYSPDQARSMVLSICRYHRNSNGWDDVGYNFLVDRYGTIYEGRAGGIDQPVVGAHVQGWNSVSTGIANLGTHTSVPQNDTALDAISRLIAWKLPLHGVPVSGRVTLTSAGGSENRYPAGQAVSLERISGHRDGGRSSCPGDALYAQLAHLRAITEQRAPADGGPTSLAARRSTLSASLQRRKVVFPEPGRIAGRLTSADGLGLEGRQLEVQIGTTRGFKTAARATTGDAGSYVAELPSTRNRTVRVVFRGSDGVLASRRLRLRVAPSITASGARRVLAGRRLVLTGQVRPRRSRLVATAYREVRRGRFARSVAVRGSGARGAYRLAVPLRRPGLYRVRLSSGADSRNPAGRSAFLYVRAVRSASALRPGPAPGSSSGGGGLSAPAR